MNDDAWQSLSSLESQDLVCKFHESIYRRTLNFRRSREIAFSVKQSREYFSNSSRANIIVKPLLTFYGVASLSRALSLLLNRDGGEETLGKGHGLETLRWNEILSGEMPQALENSASLRIRTCKGLFSDLLSSTNNGICCHARSSAVDWRLSYKLPSLGTEMSIDDLCLRLPDLSNELRDRKLQTKFSFVNEISYSADEGLHLKVSQNDAVASYYKNVGYHVEPAAQNVVLKADSDTFERAPVQFTHTYLGKTFGIPGMFATEPFPNDERYSQIAICYMVSYCLGMLARYYPTHWISMSTGQRGDHLWPTLRQAQRIVEISFPELVDEFVRDRVAQGSV